MLLCLLALPGCPPTETPGYSPDGKTIALVATDPSTKRNAVWIYDIQQQVARAHHVPADWNVTNVQWIGPQLWVECMRTVTTGEQAILCPFDPKRDEFAEAPRIVRRSLLAGSIRFAIAAHAGTPALFVESDDPEQHEIYTFNNPHPMLVQGRLDVLSAGGGWSVQPLFTANGATADLREVVVSDATGAKRCTISATQIALACHRNARTPRAARVSRDEKVVALAFDTETIYRNHPRKYTFGVFSAETGQLLWAGGSDSMDGVPLVQRDQLCTIELVGREVYVGEKPFNLGGGEPADPPKHRFALVRHQPGKTSSQADGQRTVMFEYDLGNESFIQSFAPSPDGSQMLVAVSGARPRLLFVPIKADAGAADAKSVELK